MRVLLPLKKKLDQHDDYDDSDEYSSSSSSDGDGDELLQQQQLYYTVDESDLLVNNEEFPEEEEVPEESKASDAQAASLKAPASVAESQNRVELPQPRLQQPPLQNSTATVVSEEAAATSSTKSQTEYHEHDLKAPALPDAAQLKVASLPQSHPPRPTSVASVSEHDNTKPAAVSTEVQPKQPLQFATVASVAAAAPPTAASGCPASPPRASGNRKRRSTSPPLDSKPASTKSNRRCSPSDTKPPAVAVSAADQQQQQQEDESKMAGGRRLLNREDSAELDVRYTYFPPENDPASARGDAPTASFSTPNLRLTNHNSSSNNAASAAAAAASMARDDQEEDAREPAASTTTLHAAAPQQARPVVDTFAAVLKKKGLEMVEQDGDGNCLFRAISLQVYGDASMHEEVRHRCLDFMARDKEHFSQFITDEPFEQYIRRKRQDGVHGNNPEIQAASELFNRPIEVFVPQNGATPLNIFHAEYKTEDAPIRLSYHDRSHYNAVIDPLVPTAGLGLGLPGLQPGLADKMQVAKAVAESDRLADQREYERALEESQNDQLQRAIKESTLSVDHMYNNKALSLSDCDATNFELEQAVLESSLESFRTYEHGRKQASSSSSAASASCARRQRPPTAALAHNDELAMGPPVSSAVASIPQEARQDAGSSSTVPRAASVATASVSMASAAAPAAASRPPSSDDNTAFGHAASSGSNLVAEQYPQSVQELVMNGFDLRKVVHAYELVGDNFDALLSLLMSGQS